MVVTYGLRTDTNWRVFGSIALERASGLSSAGCRVLHNGVVNAGFTGAPASVAVCAHRLSLRR